METTVNTLVKTFPYGDVMDWMIKIRHLENCLKAEGWARKKNRKLSDNVFPVAMGSLAYTNFPPVRITIFPQ